MICLFFCFAACNNTIKIEDYDWQLATVQSSQSGEIAASNEYLLAHPEIGDVIELKMVCTAKDGIFILTDKMGSVQYSGSYCLDDSQSHNSIYSLETKKAKGNAVVSMTQTKAKNTPTLIITLNDYVLTFYD